MRIKSDGNVGIGSISPARKLDVSTNGSDTYGIRNSYSASYYMEMAHNRFNTVGNNYIRFNIDDSTKMTIVDSDFGGGVNGVGIGFTSPTTELQVSGTISGYTGRFENAKISNFNSSSYAAFGHENAADNEYAIRQQSNTNTHINAGISRNIEFRQGNSTQGGFTAVNDFFVGASSTSNVFYVDRSEESVGIGTYAPSGTLEVSDTTGILRISSTKNSTTTVGEKVAGLEFFSDDDSGSSADTVRASINLIAETTFGSSHGLALSTKGDVAGDPVERVRINRIGNVGIGTDDPATYKLQLGAAGDKIGIDLSSGGVTRVSEIELYDASDGSINLRTNNASTGGINFHTQGSQRVTIARGGSVGIGTTIPSNALDVVGHFSATSKSFLIDHPTKENKKLQYASLEGPENGVYARGTTNSAVIELPDYWSALVHEDSITVVLTPIGKKQDLYIKSKSPETVMIGGVEGSYDYVVYGERKDIDRLEIEPDGN